jgi:hypothetical protein
MLSVPIGRVRYWVAEKLLLTKGSTHTSRAYPRGKSSLLRAQRRAGFSFSIG